MAERELTFYGDDYSEGCPGCTRIEPQPPGLDLVYENDGFRVHQDYEIPIPGFMIIEAKRHVAKIGDLARIEKAQFLGAWVRVEEAIQHTLGVDQITAFQENRAAHFHFCLLPVLPWMNSVTGQRNRNIQEIMDYGRQRLTGIMAIREVEDTTQKIKEYLKKDQYLLQLSLTPPMPT